MFYLIPMLLSLSILLSISSLIFTVKVSALNPPIVLEEKPSIENIQNQFAKIYKSDNSISRGIGDIKILAIASGSTNMALISYGGEMKTVKLRSKIGEYEVKEIKRNYILISKSGKVEKISYAFEKSESSSDNKVAKIESFTKREIEKLTHDPGVLFQEIRLKPFIEDGKTRGFTFEWIKPGSIFEKAGIKQGDVLLSINNIEIKSGEDAFKILQALRNEPSLKVSLLRDGKNIDVNLRVD